MLEQIMNFEITIGRELSKVDNLSIQFNINIWQVCKTYCHRKPEVKKKAKKTKGVLFIK